MRTTIILAVAVAALALAGCSEKQPPPKVVQTPAPTVKADLRITCPSCGASLRPEELIRPQGSAHVALCPKCKARVPPPTVAAPK